MWNLLIIVLTIIATINPLSESKSFCESLDEAILPFHGNVPQMITTSPFRILTSASTAYQSEVFTVRIKSVLSELDFSGLAIHARSSSQPSKVIGKFMNSSAGLYFSNCDGEDNTATYIAQPGVKGEIELQWQVPNDYLGEIVFHATIAQDYEKFWVGITSAPIEILQSDALRSIRALISSAIRSNDANQPLEQRNSELIYGGCGTTKTCFGLPVDCVNQQSCDAVVTAAFVNNQFEFELQSNAVGVGYVAVGLSRNNQMDYDSVMECVHEQGIVRAYTSHNERRANTRVDVPQNFISLLDSSYVNGTIYCRLARDAITTVLETQFNLFIENFYFLLAIGTTFTATAITRHDISRLPSSAPLEIIGQRDTIYDGCGTTKTCFGLPVNCVDQQSCQAVVTAAFVNNQFEFELQSSAVGVGYVAVGLSRNNQMDYDSVMECVHEQGVVRAYTSHNERRANTRVDVPQNIISLLDSSYVNGTIYCRLAREAITTVLETQFNLFIENFYFLLAIGTTFTAESITRHDISRLPSATPLAIIGERDIIYEGCGTTKTCFGLPVNCVDQQSCQAVVTAAFVNNQYEFELQSNAVGVGYVAVGLSRNNQMDYDSVMECVHEQGVVRAYTSHNERRANTRVGVPQTIISLLDSSYVNGTIYCRLARDAITTVLETQFNLFIENFYFLLAIGTTFTAESITRHDISRLPSATPLAIIGQRDSIYDGCGADNKTCFGMPEDCVENESCRAIVAVTVVDERYEFELESGVVGVRYVAFGLSRDDRMGEDSVIECIVEEGVVRAYSSWNHPRSNTRDQVPQNIFTLHNSSFVDGSIYCKLEREPSTVVLGSEFDLTKEDFHFLLAIGNNITETSILIHTLGSIASPEPITLPGRSGGQYAAKISAISVVVWFLVTSCTYFLREKL